MMTVPSPSKLFSKTEVPFTKIISEWEHQTEEKVNENFPSNLNSIENLINSNYSVGSYIINLASLAYMLSGEKIKQAVLSAYVKGLWAIISSYKLTKIGYIGPSRPNFRFIFESLIIGKFISLCKEQSIYNKWQCGDKRINFKNEILDRITFPDTVHFKNLWEITSKYSHATKYSQQVSFDWDYLYEEVNINLSLLELLIHFHSHLLLTHVMQPSLNYYYRYFDDKDIQDLRVKKLRLRTLLLESKKGFSSDSKECVSWYCMKWKIN